MSSSAFASRAVRVAASLALLLSSLLALGWLKPWEERHLAAVTFEYSGDILKGTRQADGQLFQPLVREFFETQKVIIASRALCERAVDQLSGAEHGFAFKGRPARARTVTDVCRRLSVRRVGEALIVELRYQDVDPERATLFADTLADAYVERTRGVYAPEAQNAKLWQGELEQREASLADSEQALKAFAEAHDLSSMEAKRAIVEDELRSYTEALTQLRIRKVALEAKLNALLQSRSEQGLGFTDDDARAKVLRVRLAELEVEAAGRAQGEAGADAGARDYRVFEEINRVRAQLAEVWSDAANELKAQLKVMEAEEQELARLADLANRQGIELMGVGVEYARLDRAARLHSTVRAGLVSQMEKAHSVASGGGWGPVRVLSRAYPVEDEWQWARWAVPAALLMAALGAGWLARRGDPSSAG